MALQLTSALLRSLMGDVPETVSVVASAIQTRFVNTITDPEVEYCGMMVPQRLLQWYKSPVKAEALRMAKDEATAPDIRIEFYGGGGASSIVYMFYIKRPDKKAGYYSGAYATKTEASDDLDRLLMEIGGLDSDERMRLLERAGSYC